MENNGSESQKSEPEPKIIGLTGGIGAGKSTVAKFIEEKGFAVYYSDLRATAIVNDNDALKEQIKNLLGREAYDDNGLYNRKYVASVVFADSNVLQSLNEIIHPAVRQDFDVWLKAQTADIVFKETALLFELGLETECYKSLLVTADDNFRIKRVMDRDGKTYREVEAVIDHQLPEKDKIRKADFVVYNNGSVDLLHAEVDEILQKIVAQADKD